MKADLFRDLDVARVSQEEASSSTVFFRWNSCEPHGHTTACSPQSRSDLTSDLKLESILSTDSHSPENYSESWVDVRMKRRENDRKVNNQQL